MQQYKEEKANSDQFNTKRFDSCNVAATEHKMHMEQLGNFFAVVTVAVKLFSTCSHYNFVYIMA